MTVRTRLLGTLATGAVAAALLTGCGSDDQVTDLPNTTDSSQTPSETSTPSPAPTDTITPSTPSTPNTSASTGDQVAVPAYFVGQTPMGKRLYREFQDVSPDAPVDEALALIASDAAQDPDYTTLLPVGEGVPKSYNQDEGFAVSVPEAWADAPEGMTTQEAQLAVQQIVYTVQGVLQDRTPIQFVDANGDPSTVLGLTAPDGGFTAAKFDQVLALVNVTTPTEGQTVSGTFSAEGVASSFEGNVPWEIDDSSGSKVLDGSAQADGYIDDVYPWKTDVDVSSLSPGTYTFVASTDDASGSEGPGPTKDTKTITVQ